MREGGREGGINREIEGNIDNEKFEAYCHGVRGDYEYQKRPNSLMFMFMLMSSFGYIFIFGFVSWCLKTYFCDHSTITNDAACATLSPT